MTAKTTDLQAALRALERAAENSLGSHLGQAEAFALVELLSDLAKVERRAQNLVDLEGDKSDFELTAFQRSAWFVLTGEKVLGDPTRDVEV